MILEDLATANKKSIKKITTLEGGILFFDLVKFTGLTTSLAEDGPHGAETLREVLLNYYDAMVNTIHDYGGSVYQFAGDSALSSFVLMDGETEDEAVARLASCAVAMRDLMSSFENIKLGAKTYTLQTKFSLSYGEFHQVVLGESDSFYDVAILGKVVDQCVRAESFAEAGDIIITDSLVTTLKKQSSEMDLHGDIKKLLSVGVKATAPGEKPLNIEINEKDFLKKCSHFVSPLLVEKISTSIQGFLGEFREVTSVFINIKGLDYINDLKKAINELNSFFKYIQKESKSFGGALIQTDFSDKGSVFLVLFGAPLAQEKKEIMAMIFALKVCENRSQFPFVSDLHIGISSGPLYCGDMGAQHRKGYSVLGESVNYASRLMEFSNDGVVCIDKYTERSVADQFELQREDGVFLKGMLKEQTLFHLIEEKSTLKSSIVQEHLVGRKKELSWLMSKLDNLLSQGETCAILGEAGVGKSRLIIEFQMLAKQQGFTTWFGVCYSYEKFTPYFAWKPIFSKIFNFSEIDTESKKIAKIKERILELSDVSTEWVPVFGQICGISVQEESFTADLDARQKHNRIMEIIHELISTYSNKNKLAIVIEDFHWVDDASMSVIEYLTDNASNNVLLVLVLRPEVSVKSFLKFPNFSHIDLNELSAGDSREYLRIKMKLDIINEEIENNILNRAHGNPFYIESIVHSLREQKKLVQKENGKFHFTDLSGDLDIPNSLQGVLLTRIDRLTEEEQATLKTAAVIGRLFPFNLVKELSSDNLQKSLKTDLKSLEDNDFMLIESKSPLTYFFKHIMIREVAYNSLLQSTKRNLHNKIGNILEREYASNLAEQSDILAYHFLAGEEDEKSILYCLMSAQKAISRYGNKDALYYFGKVLDLKRKAGLTDENSEILEIQESMALANSRVGNYDVAITLYEDVLSKRKHKIDKANIYAGLGYVYQEQGRIELATEMLEKSLDLLGKKAPSSTVGIYLGIAKNLIIHEFNVILPFTIRKTKEKGHKKSVLQKRSMTLGVLEKIYYFSNLEKLAWANLENVIVANKLNEPESISSAYANFGLIMTGLGFRKRADKYYKKGIEFAKKTKNPGVEAVAFSRFATKGFYEDDPILWRTNNEKAVEMFKEVSNQWELCASFTQIGLAYIFTSDFDKTIDVFKELQKKAEEAGLKIYSVWSVLHICFCRYLIADVDPRIISKELFETMKLLEAEDDKAAILTVWNYLCTIAETEGNVEQCVEYAQRAFEATDSFDIFLPDSHLAYAGAAECALFALENGSGDSRVNHKIIKKGLNKLLKWGKDFPTVLGPAMRVWSRYEFFLGKRENARKSFEKTIEVLENGENRWQTGLAYLNAADCFEDVRAEYIEKAERIFKEKHIAKALFRVEEMKNKYTVSA